MRTEISVLEQLRATTDLRGAVLTGLDLTGEELRGPLDGALFLGCLLSPMLQRRAEAAGALTFPVIPDVRIYRHSRPFGKHPDPLHALAEWLHDHAITEALTGKPVAVMGRHAPARVVYFGSKFR